MQRACRDGRARAAARFGGRFGAVTQRLRVARKMGSLALERGGRSFGGRAPRIGALEIEHAFR
jgi:hypothetical protein